MKKVLQANGLNRFAVNKEPKMCQVCWKPFKELNSINYRTWDVTRHYVGSGRPMVGTYNIKCCPKCYGSLLKAIDEAVEKVCQYKGKI